MRVIGGTAKGRRVKSFKGQSLRPTADRVKEALFNILPRDLSGWKVLDLFAGTGNLTFEALSRGAEQACLVDVSREAAKMIRKNIEALEFSRSARVLGIPVLRAIHVFIARASGVPKGSDDAKTAETFTEKDLPSPLVFDHARILKDYFRYKKTGRRPGGIGRPCEV